MLLAIDIGNTNITLGVWDGTQWQLQWRLRTVRNKTADEYGIELKTLLREFNIAPIQRVIVASVVPTLTATFTAMSTRYLHLPALHVRYNIPLNVRVATDNPAEVGADRIANAAAAYHLHPGASIVVDMGTATTFDVVSADGRLLGVVIAPGMRLTADALTSHAAQLPQFALEAPPHIIGRNTIHAMQSGIVYGYVSLIEGVLKRLIADLNTPTTVIGTGGLTRLITPHTDIIQHVDPWLTLTGLRVISDLNTPTEAPQ